MLNKVVSSTEFHAKFRADVRVNFNWKRFLESEWLVEVRNFLLPRDAGRIYTSWYLESDGAVCGYNSPGALPQSVEAVVQSPELMRQNAVRSQYESKEGLVVPAFAVEENVVILMDGNHRVVAAHAGGCEHSIVAYVVNGPIDEAVLADLRCWLNGSN